MRWINRLIKQLICGLCCFGISLPAFAANPLRVSIGNSPPVEYSDAGGRPAGFNVDVIKEAARRTGIAIIWQPGGVIEANNTTLRAGKLDMIAGASASDARRRDFYVSEPWWWSEMIAITPGNSPLRAESDFAGRKLVVTSAGRATATSTYGSAIILTAPNVRGAMAQVCEGAADAALIENMYLRELLPGLAPACRDLHFRVFDISARREFHIIARRGVERDARLLRAEIDEMTSDGTLAMIAARRLPVSTPQATRVAELLRARQDRQMTRLRIAMSLAALSGFLAFVFWQRRSKAKLREVNTRLATAQQELETALAQLETAFDGLNEAVLIFDPQGSIQYANGPARQSLGATGSVHAVTVFELAAQSRLRPVQESITDETLTPFRRILDGEVLRSEILQAGEAPDVRTLECNGALVRDKTNQPILGVATFRDVTEARQMEAEREDLRQEVAQAQKMESLGRLAGGVAHDFNNLLTVINGNASLLLEDRVVPAPAEKQLKAIAAAGETAAHLTRQLLDFSRKRKVKPESVDMNILIGAMAAMLGPTMGDRISIETVESSGSAAVLGDETQMRQLIVNLAVNARDAMPQGGVFRLEICPVEFPAGKPDGGVCLCVSDTGMGMSTETMHQMFEPFFTTKSAGNGLGLAIVDEITRRWGGSVAVSSSPGHTSFRIIWPRAPNPDQMQLAKSPTNL
jgi:signal transduction histidine kinase/ABC-type amino acid transport substrate-binding protein